MTSPVILRHRRATVTLTTETTTLRDTGEVVPTRFVITTTTGYRAILPACGCERKPCRKPENHPIDGKHPSVDTWLKHARDHCHQWHAPAAERLAQAVLKTYAVRRRSA